MSLSISAPGVIGRQQPTFYHLPTSAVPKLGSVGREVADLAKLAKLDLDPWQIWIIERSCQLRNETVWNTYANRNEFLWAAFEVAVMLSRGGAP